MTTQILRTAILCFAILPTCWTWAGLPPEPKFRAQTIDTEIGVGYGLALADVDGDGKSDIVLVDQHSIQWYRNPDWTRHMIVSNLTERDHVAIAARDIDGDGKAELAAGAAWAPGDTMFSGAVFFLKPPADRTQPWSPVALHHEPTVHRMLWIKQADGTIDLVVKPLQGRGNKNGVGPGSRILRYHKPKDEARPWEFDIVADSLHMTHGLHAFQIDDDPEEEIGVAAKEGLWLFDRTGDTWKSRQLGDQACGEFRDGRLPGGSHFVATIEPMHGTKVAIYVPDSATPLWKRTELDASLTEGHAVVVADFLGTGSSQVAAGWRAGPSPGARLYTPLDEGGSAWRTTQIAGPEMAVEDMKSADLNGDGQPDLVLAGRATKNVIILWNETKK